MAQSGFTPIQLFRTTTASAVPTAGSLADGELAINLTDEKLYFKNAAGVVKLLSASSGASGTVTSVDVSGGTTGLSFSGGPITTSGTITMAGTLGVANGGTGASTLSSGYLLKGNGTSAVSASVVYDNGTNVGIGTASPGYLLQVGSRVSVGSDGVIQWGQALTGSNRGILSWDTNIASVNAATNLVLASNGTTERMRITTAGDVGIGTSAPGTKLHVFAGVATITSPTVNATSYATREDGLYFTRNDIPTTWRNKISNSWSGDPSFTTMNFELATGSATNNTVMSLFANGSVGIGTVTPSAKLDVNGTGYFSDNVSIVRNNTAGSLSGLTINNPGTTAAYAGINISSGTVTSQLFNDAAGNAVVAGAVLRTTTNHPFVFGTNATERMRITAGGDVGIGTSSPGARFDVRGIAQFFSGVSGSFNFIDVGRTTSEARVAVAAASGDFVAGTTAGDAVFYNPTASNAWFGVAGAGSAVFTTNSTERMRITSAGNVGIGTASPTTKLTVNNGAITAGTSGDVLLGRFDSSFPTPGAAYFRLRTNNTDASNGGLSIDTLSANTLTERARIDTNGVLSVGATAIGDNNLLVQLNAGAGQSRFFAVNKANNYGIVMGYNNVSDFGQLGVITAAPLLFLTSNAERARIDANGNLLVGTTATNGRLSVVGDQISIAGGGGSGQLGLQIKGIALNAIPAAQVQGYIATGDSTIGVAGDLLIAPRTDVTASVRFITGTTPAERMRISSIGDVGIGTTTPAYRLDVEGASNTQIGVKTPFLAAGSNASPIYQAIRFFGYANVERARITGIDTASNNVNGQLAFWTGQGGSMVEAMRIDAVNNVGIGTTSPAARLDVDVAGTAGTGLIVKGSALTSSQVNIGIGVVTAGRPFIGTNTSTNPLEIGTRDNAALLFLTNTAERMRVTGSGNVGIGTSAPLRTFSVLSGSLVSADFTTSSASSYLDVVDGSANTMRIGSFNGVIGIAELPTTVPTMSFVSGNVGVGTSTPGYKLEARTDNATASNWITSFNNTATGPYGAGFIARAVSNFGYFYIRGDGIAYVENAGNNPLALATNGLERMRVTGAGDVGIGTSSPNAKLHVAGSFQNVFTAGVGGTTLIGAIGGLSNGYEITVDTSNNITHQWRKGDNNPSMTLTAAGFVGINTPSPSALLHVQAGDALIKSSSDGSNGVLRIQNTAGTTTVQSYADNNDGWLSVVEAKRLSLATGNIRRMCIDSVGNVGIGTAAPVNRLQVFYTSTAPSLSSDAGSGLSLVGSSTLRVNIGSDPSSPFGGWIQASNGSGTPFPLNVNPLGGNVGIGTAAPIGRFAVQASQQVGFNGAVSGSPQAGNLFYGTDNTGWKFDIGKLVSGTFTAQMTFQDNGNVGVGTTSPAVRFVISNAGTNGFEFNTSDNIFQTYNRATSAYTDMLLYALQHRFFAGTSPTERMRIDSSGNVMVGTTSANNRFLVTYANPVSVPAAGAGGHCTAFGTVGYGLATGALTNGNAYLQVTRWDATATNYDLLLQPNGGNVLIGTGTSGYKLEVAAGGSNIRAYTASGNAEIMIQSAAGGAAILDMQTVAGLNRIAGGVGGTSNLSFYTASTERVRIDSSGNVGIGTTSPGAPLDVVGTTRSGNFRVNSGGNVTGGGMWGNDTNLAFNTGSTERVRIDSSGNVGVGTATPNNRLQSAYSVPASVPASGAGAHGLAVGSANFGLAAGALNNGNGYLQATRWDGTAGNYDLLLQPNGGNVGVGTIGAGNVGIGTTAPVTKLDVSGNHSNTRARLYSTGGDGTSGFGPSILSLWASEPGVSYTGAGIGGNISGSVGQGRVDSTNGQSYIRFMPADIVFGTSATDAVERMRIDSSGNVGIATSSPTGTLQVAGTSAFSWSGGGATSALAVIGTQGTAGGSLFVHTASLNSSFASGLAIDGTYSSPLSTINIKAVGVRSGGGYGSNISFQTSNENTLAERMRITNTGNVGIGTTSPSLKFVVSNGGAAGLEIDPTALASAPIIQSYNRSGAAYTQLGYNALQHIWQVSGSEGMRIDSSGNVGIGTASPESPFQVLARFRVQSDGVVRWGSDVRAGFFNESGYLTWNTGRVTVGYQGVGAVTFETSGQERMRIESGGNFLVGTTSATAGYLSTINGALLLGNGSSLSWGAAYNSGGPTVAGSTNFLAFYPNGVTSGETMRITSAGNVGIGTASPSAKLHVIGAILASDNVTAYSDIRVKDNIEQIGGALDRVQRIRGVTYTRTDREDTERRFAGVIAQEIEQVLPEAIFDSGDLKAVDYNATIGLLIEAIKELTARVAELEGK